MIAKRLSRGWPVFVVAGVCILLAVVGIVSSPQPARALPPRPTVGSTSSGSGAASTGAQIQLQVQFPTDWPWQSTHWQTLWTVVQWQHPQGGWHDVAGWRGTLDTVKVTDDGPVTGYKSWWLDEQHLGQGPFRWRVYRSQDGGLLATSEPFDLPQVKRSTLVIAVKLVR